ncbi:MAG: S26 family signal peptidase [Acidimicrobiales bacterium]
MRRPAPFVWAVVVSGAVLAVGACLRSFRRVEVAGASMAPALLAGDRLVVVGVPWGSPPWPAPGDVVALRDPRDRGRILVKRVVAVDRSAGTIEVLGDAVHASTDSRTFGPVPRSSIVGRAVYRYAPADRSGPPPWPGEYHRA